MSQATKDLVIQLAVILVFVFVCTATGIGLVHEKEQIRRERLHCQPEHP
jgi:hypothetical protein